LTLKEAANNTRGHKAERETCWWWKEKIVRKETWVGRALGVPRREQGKNAEERTKPSARQGGGNGKYGREKKWEDENLNKKKKTKKNTGRGGVKKPNKGNQGRRGKYRGKKEAKEKGGKTLKPLEEEGSKKKGRNVSKRAPRETQGDKQ